MNVDRYNKIRETHIPEYNIPEAFFLPAADQDYCIFLISCLSKDKFIYLDQNFSDLTGYSNELFIKEGMDLWFSLICPDDMEAVTPKIIDAHKALFSPGYDPMDPAPLVLEYRFRHAQGDWVWIRDSRYLVSFNEDHVIDKVLCRFELMPVGLTDLDMMKDLLNKGKSCTKMLEQAMVHQNGRSKQALNGAANQSLAENPVFVDNLTKREKEILKLIGQGLSTKMIAHQCGISIHTVETHRRHLLEKLNVKNSMELIKEASKVFWL